VTSKLQIALGAAALGAAAATRRKIVAKRADAIFFHGKNVVLTGGSRGLGFVVARRLLEAGANVTLCGRSAHAVDAAPAEFAQFGLSQALVAELAADGITLTSIVPA
jgi:hypothetical protein